MRYRPSQKNVSFGVCRQTRPPRNARFFALESQDQALHLCEIFVFIGWCFHTKINKQSFKIEKSILAKLQ